MRDPSLRVAVVNDYEIVVEGLAAMMGPEKKRGKGQHLKLKSLAAATFF